MIFKGALKRMLAISRHPRKKEKPLIAILMGGTESGSLGTKRFKATLPAVRTMVPTLRELTRSHTTTPSPRV